MRADGASLLFPPSVDRRRTTRRVRVGTTLLLAALALQECSRHAQAAPLQSAAPEADVADGTDEAGDMHPARRAGQAPIPPECQDPVPGWADSEGYTCEMYRNLLYCNRDGSWADDWEPSWLGYDAYANGGYDAGTACCACGACPSCRGCANPLPLQKPEHFAEFAAFGCSHVTGQLFVRPKDNVDLEALAGLESVSGRLIIRPAPEEGTGVSSVDVFVRPTPSPKFTSLGGLGNLTSVGGDLKVRDCIGCTSMDGLQGLESIGGALELTSLEGLRSLQGLEGLTSVGKMVIASCLKLESIAALGGLKQSVQSILLANLPRLRSLHGLEGLTGTGLPQACACQGCRALSQSFISIQRCPQLQSIAALGSVHGGVNEISISGTGALLSLQGIEGILARSLTVEPGPELCVTEAQRRHLEALPAVCGGGANGTALVTGYARGELPAPAGTCTPCQPPCGRLPGGQPIECDYRSGECLCPLGTRGQGCWQDLPRISVVPSQSFDCLLRNSSILQNSSLRRGPAVCSVRIALVQSGGGTPADPSQANQTRNSNGPSQTSRIGPTGLSVYEGGSQGTHPSATASQGLEYESIALDSVTWHSATYGEAVMHVALRRRSAYSGRRTVLHVEVGYDPAVFVPDLFLEGTTSNSPLASAAPRIYPWCLGLGAGCRLTSPVPVEVGFRMTPGTVRFRRTSAEVLESGEFMAAVLERIGGDEGEIWVAVEVDLAASTATLGADFHFHRKVVRWADEDTQQKAFLIELADDAVWEPSESVVLHIAEVSHVDVRGAAAQRYDLTLLDDGDGGALRLRANGSLPEAAGRADECLVLVERFGGSSGSASVEVVLEPVPQRCGAPSNAVAHADGPTVPPGAADFSFVAGRRLAWADGEAGMQCAFRGPGAAQLTAYLDWSAEENEFLCLRLANAAGTVQVQASEARALVTIVDGGTGGERGSYFKCDRGSCRCRPGWYANSSVRADECWRCEPGHHCGGGWLRTACRPGTFAAASGATACELCRAGTFQERRGASSCAPCSRGSFSNSSGASACSRCTDDWGLEGFTTAAAEATSAADCACPHDYFLPCAGGLCPAGQRPPFGGCMACPPGFACPGGLHRSGAPQRLRASTDGGPLLGPDVLVHAEPLLAQGYFSARETPYCAVRCGIEPAGRICPGERPPGECGGPHRRDVLACGSCESGYYSNGGECVACDDGVGNVLPILLGFPLTIVALTIVAHMANQSQSKQRHAVATFAATVSLATFSAQALGNIGHLSITWISPAGDIMDALNTVFNVLQLRLLQVDCNMDGETHFASYALSLSLVLILIGLTLVIVAARTRRMTFVDFRTEATQTVGTLLLAFFIVVLVTTVQPFIFFDHPCGGLASLRAYPNVFAGSEEQVPLIIAGLTAALFIPLAFVAICSWATWQVTGRLAQGDTSFFQSYRFLFGKFRQEAYYYGLVQLTRNAALSMVPVLIGDNATGQLLLCVAATFLPMVIQVSLQPWRLWQINLLETVCLGQLVLVLFFGALFTEAPKDTATIEAAQIVLLLLFIVVLVLSVASLLWAAIWAMRPKRRFAFFICHAKGDAGTRARALQLKLVQQSRWPTDTYIDADHLPNLDVLFETVRSDVRNMVVLLSHSTLTRPWCAGEIATAVQNAVPIIPVCCSDFVPPEDLASELPSMLDYGASSLAKYEIAPQDITAAYQRLLEMSAITADRRLGCVEMVALVGEIFARSQGVLRCHQPSKAVEAGDGRRRPQGRVAFFAEPGDAEGAAGAVVLHHLLQPSLEDGCFLQVERGMAAPDRQELLEYLAIPRSIKGSCHTAVFLLSRSTLSSPAALAVILAAVERRREDGLNVVSVELPGFTYPTRDFYESELPQLLEALEVADPQKGAEELQDFFKIISVPLSACSGSLTVLQAQAREVMQRILALEGPQKSPRSNGTHASGSPRSNGLKEKIGRGVCRVASAIGAASAEREDGAEEAEESAEGEPERWDVPGESFTHSSQGSHDAPSASHFRIWI